VRGKHVLSREWVWGNVSIGQWGEYITGILRGRREEYGSDVAGPALKTQP